jgi:hypothetical protein
MDRVTIDGRLAGPAPAPAPSAHRPRRRWLFVGTLAWAVVVTGAAIWGAHRSQPTAREQTTIAQALPVVDTAVADVVTAAGAGSAGGAGSVAAITGYAQLSGDCRVTSARSGSRFERAALIYTAAGTESALLDRIKAGLPASYRARVRHLGAAPTLSADAGTFVAVTGTVTAPGVVRIAASTGCRPQDRPVTEAEAAVDRGPVEAVFATLGVTPGGWHVHRVSCRSGRTLWTVEATGGPGSAPSSLPAALTVKPAVVIRPDLYAFRSGPVGVVARTANGVLTVTATTGCV